MNHTFGRESNSYEELPEMKLFYEAQNIETNTLGQSNKDEGGKVSEYQYEQRNS